MGLEHVIKVQANLKGHLMAIKDKSRRAIEAQNIIETGHYEMK